MAFRPFMHYVALLLVLLLVCCLGIARAQEEEPVYAYTPATTTLYFLRNFSSGIPVLATNWTGDSYDQGWMGVTVDSDGYVHLDISNMDLSGTLPNYYVPEQNILVTEIDLAGNGNLVGDLRTQWYLIPALRKLDLSSTGMYGETYYSWHETKHLQYLNLSNLPMCGFLTTWTSTEMVSVDFSNCGLARAPLEDTWADLPHLAHVDLSGNQFCGCVPESWYDKPVLMAAVEGMAVANTTTCANENPCEEYFDCSTTTSRTPTTTTTTTTTEEPTTTASTTTTTSTTEEPTTTTTTEEPTTTTTTTEEPTTTTTTTVEPTTTTTTEEPTTTSTSTTTTTTEKPTTTTTTTEVPTTTTTTTTVVPTPSSAAFRSAAVASCVTLATLAVAALIA